MDWLVVRPAYGVKLNSQKAINEHYANNKDFEILGYNPVGGTYVSKSECERFELTLEVRYGQNLTKLHIVNGGK